MSKMRDKHLLRKNKKRATCVQRNEILSLIKEKVILLSY